MATRDELLAALAGRYRNAARAEKGLILKEFVEVTGYHRKHAGRLLRGPGLRDRAQARPFRRIYDDAVREALIVLWETSDRICGKRLRPLIPMLMTSMERHGHLALDAGVRTRLAAISAATIDRILAPVRAAQASPRGRRRAAPRRRWRSGAAFRCGPSRTGAIRLPAFSRPISSPTAVRRGVAASSRRWS